MVVEGIALYFFIVNLVRTPETLRRVIWTLVLVGAAIGAVILIQELTRNYSNWFLGFAQTTFEPGDDRAARSSKDRSASRTGSPR